MRPVILMTRPAPDGAATARTLAGLTGLEVVESPVLAITPAPTLPDMADVDLLILTSANAARCYARLLGPARPAICVGEATAEAAREAGLTPEVRGGDAEALVTALLADPPPGRMLHLRGEHARGELAATLAGHGLPIRDAVVYAQDAQPLTPQAATLLAGPAPVIVPLYSPRSAALFAEAFLALPGTPPLPVPVAISGNVSRALAPLRADHIWIATTPDADGMTQAIMQAAQRVEGNEGAD